MSHKRPQQSHAKTACLVFASEITTATWRINYVTAVQQHFTECHFVLGMTITKTYKNSIL